MDSNNIGMDNNNMVMNYKPIVMNCEATIMENAQKALNGDKKYRYQTQIKPSFSATRNETLRVTYFVCLRQSVCGTHVFPVPANFEDYHIFGNHLHLSFYNKEVIVQLFAKLFTQFVKLCKEFGK